MDFHVRTVGQIGNDREVRIMADYLHRPGYGLAEHQVVRQNGVGNLHRDVLDSRGGDFLQSLDGQRAGLDGDSIEVGQLQDHRSGKIEARGEKKNKPHGNKHLGESEPSSITTTR